jgi:hypothetical protein
MKMSANHHFRLPALAALALACVAPQAWASDGDWNWRVVPYVWAAGMTTDLHTDTPINGGSDTKFTDLIDKLDGAFMIHGEGQTEHWGMFGDFGFIGLAAEGEHGLFDTQSDMDVRLVELAGVWSPGDGTYEGFEPFAGLRRVEVDFNTDFDPHNVLIPTTNFKFNRDYNDFLLGARYIVPLSDKWSLWLRGDGSWGDTAGTWGGSATVAYKAGHGEWSLGYRALTGKFKNDDSDLKIRLSGFEVGYAFRF